MFASLPGSFRHISFSKPGVTSTSAWGLRQKDQEFEASYDETSSPKQKKIIEVKKHLLQSGSSVDKMVVLQV